MKSLVFTKNCLPTKLRGELEAAVSSLRPAAGANGELFSPLQVEWNGTQVRLTVPDDADVAAVTAVVETHQPGPALIDVQRAKLVELDAAYKVALVQDFESSASGELHRYGYSQNDQWAMVKWGSYIMANPDAPPFDWRTRDGGLLGGLVTLTPSQFVVLGRDVAAHEQAVLAQYRTLADQVMVCTTIEEVAAVAWPSE